MITIPITSSLVGKGHERNHNAPISNRTKSEIASV